MGIEFNLLLNSISLYIAPRTTKYVNLVCACHLGEEVPGPFPAQLQSQGKVPWGRGWLFSYFLLKVQTAFTSIQFQK